MVLIWLTYDESPAILIVNILSFETRGSIEVEHPHRIIRGLDPDLSKFILVLVF